MLAASFAAVLAATLAECSGLDLLAQSGIPADRGLFGETMDRLSRRLLPEPVDARDLGQLAARLFPARRDLAWLTSIPPSVVGRFAAVLARNGTSGAGPWVELERSTAVALALIAARVAGVGLYKAIRVRSPRVPLRSSPFFLLPHATNALLERRLAAEPTANRQSVEECSALHVASLETIEAVTQNLEESGVSVDVVYRLELITKNLERFRALLDCLAEEHSRHARRRRQTAARAPARRARQNERDLGQIITGNRHWHLLARRIIERAGQTGEHYITDDAPPNSSGCSCRPRAAGCSRRARRPSNS